MKATPRRVAPTSRSKVSNRKSASDTPRRKKAARPGGAIPADRGTREVHSRNEGSE